MKTMLMQSGESFALAVELAKKTGENMVRAEWPDKSIILRKDPDTGGYQAA